jgi:hypothetical protein
MVRIEQPVLSATPLPPRGKIRSGHSPAEPDWPPAVARTFTAAESNGVTTPTVRADRTRRGAAAAEVGDLLHLIAGAIDEDESE